MPAYEPREFLDLLSKDSLVEPAVFTVYGPVKADPDDAQSLLLAFSRPCDRWLRVPLSLIVSVNYARDVSCGDHEHPFVRLALRRPHSDNAEALVLAELYAQVRRAPFAATSTVTTQERSSAAGDCETFTFDDVPYACCPPAGGSGPWDCTILL
jgi:hypothetical protein